MPVLDDAIGVGVLGTELGDDGSIRGTFEGGCVEDIFFERFTAKFVTFTRGIGIIRFTCAFDTIVRSLLGRRSFRSEHAGTVLR